MNLFAYKAAFCSTSKVVYTFLPTANTFFSLENSASIASTKKKKDSQTLHDRWTEVITVFLLRNTSSLNSVPSTHDGRRWTDAMRPILAKFDHVKEKFANDETKNRKKNQISENIWPKKKKK